MADEEDVVFQNSALYEHLKEVGFADADIGTEALKPRERKEHINCAATTQWKGWLVKLCTHITQPVQRMSASTILLSASTKQQQCVRYIMHNILSCPLLEDEDAAVIQHYTCDTGYTKSHDSMSCDIPPWTSDTIIRHERVCRAMLNSVHMASLAHLFYRQWKQTIHYLDLSTVVISLSALVMHHQVDLARQACDHTRTVCHFITAIGKFYRLMKKSVRLIQETELIARGFTMVGNNSAICQLERANLQASRRQSIELRRVVFETARDCMILFKTKTEKLLQERPVSHACSYMATISLEDYGPCVSLPSSSTQLELATDNYSVSALKSMVHLCNAHVSEFLRVFALAYFTGNKPWSTGKADKDFLEICDTVHVIQRDFITHFEHVEQAYTLHQCGWVQETTARRSTELCKSRTDGQRGTIYTTMHSLSLHLQAALKRVHDLEVQLESLCEVEDRDLTSDLQQQLTSDLKVIKVNLDACNDCWDSLDDLDEHTRDVHQGAEQGLDNDQPEDSEVSPAVNLAHLLDMSEPFLQDQMYEAFPDPEETDSINKDEDSERLLAKEEKEIKQREKREALRVLSELKGVIALRALERSCYTRRSQGDILTDDAKDTKSYVDTTDEQPSCGRHLSDIHLQNQAEPEHSALSNGALTVMENDLRHETQHVDDISQQLHHTDVTSHPATTKLAFGLYGSIVVDGPECSRFPHLDKKLPQQDFSDEDKQEARNRNVSEEGEEEISSDPLSSEPLPEDRLCDVSTPVSEPSEVAPDPTTERPIIGMSFTANVALQAVARSRQMAPLSVDTFGDDSGSDSDASDEDDRTL